MQETYSSFSNEKLFDSPASDALHQFLFCSSFCLFSCSQNIIAASYSLILGGTTLFYIQPPAISPTHHIFLITLLMTAASLLLLPLAEAECHSCAGDSETREDSSPSNLYPLLETIPLLVRLDLPPWLLTALLAKAFLGLLHLVRLQIFLIQFAA